MTEASTDAALRRALAATDPSERLQAALTAGTHPDPSYIEALVEQCAIEPDFFVRDMLTWALTRHPSSLTVPRLLDEVRSAQGQARSQALHSLSKIRDPRGWEAITPDMVRDPDDTVARTAWRASVLLVPDDGRGELAATLATQLARGDRDVQQSLSRSLADLGDAARPALEDARAHADPRVRIHAIATERMIEDPEEGFDSAIFEAERIVAFGSDSS